MSTGNLVSVIAMPRAPLFPARSNNVMLPYYLFGNLNTGGGTVANSYVLSANGLFDPDITGTGQQPSGFDQMMIAYEHYTVTHAELVVTFRNLSDSGLDVALGVRADVPVVTDVATLMETGHTVSTKLSPATSTGSVKQLRIKVDVASFLGFDDLMDSNVSRGDISNNPAEGVFFHISVFSLSSIPVITAAYEARLEFHAVFSEPRVMTRSLSLALKSALLGYLGAQPPKRSEHKH